LYYARRELVQNLGRPLREVRIPTNWGRVKEREQLYKEKLERDKKLAIGENKQTRFLVVETAEECD